MFVITLLLVSCQRRQEVDQRDLKFRVSDGKAYISDSTTLFTGDATYSYTIPSGDTYSHIRPYEMGVAQGTSYRRDNNGVIWEQYELVDGEIEGKMYRYFEDRSYTVLTYQRGKQLDRPRSYYPSGKLKSNGGFGPSLKKSLVFIYYESGEVEKICHYSVGRLFQTETFYKNGLIKTRSQHKGDNKKHGMTTVYYKNGQMKEHGNYSFDNKDGLFTTWKENGSIISEIEYLDNIAITQ